MENETFPVVAVSVSDLREFGCPYCGYRSGFTPVSVGGCAVWTCGNDGCGKSCGVLAKGITKSSIGFGDVYPELQAHPRRGIPAHGRPDTRPEGSGEFFFARGIGSDITPGCFVCGGDNGRYGNIAAFVRCKEAGERVVAMFAQGAWLDYREHEPDYVQVKVGACNAHRPNLEHLRDLVADGIITTERIETATR